MERAQAIANVAQLSVALGNPFAILDDEEESECEMHSLDTFGGKECKEGGLEPERCPTPLRDSVPGRQTSDSKLAIELEEHETSIDNSLATYHK